MSWPLIPLGDVCLITAGQSPEGSTYRYEAEGLPFYQGKADFGLRFPRHRVWCVAPKKVALEGDILISVRAPVGPTNVADEKCCIGRGLASIRAGERADRDYILHSLRHFERRLASQATGSTFAAITTKQLAEFEIPLPPLPDQKRIAAILDKADALRHKRRDALSHLDRLLQSVFVDMFGDPVSNPKGWEVKPLSQLCQVNPRYRGEKRAGEAVSFVPMASVSEVSRSIVSETDRDISEVIKGFTPFEQGDVLVAKITPCFENGKMALAKIRNAYAFGSTEFHVFRPNAAQINGAYLFHYLAMPFIRSEGKRNMQGSAGQQRVPRPFFEALKVPIPPLADQQKFAAIVEQVETLRARQITAQTEADALFAALQARAFAGEL